MNLDEAIEILETEVSICSEEEIPEWVGALKLGIEALKNLQQLRSTDLRWFDPLLPGETKE